MHLRRRFSAGIYHTMTNGMRDDGRRGAALRKSWRGAWRIKWKNERKFAYFYIEGAGQCGRRGPASVAHRQRGMEYRRRLMSAMLTGCCGISAVPASAVSRPPRDKLSTRSRSRYSIKFCRQAHTHVLAIATVTVQLATSCISTTSSLSLYR